MRHACERQLHAAKWVRGRTIATSAKPARLSNAARRPRQPSCRSTSSAEYAPRIEQRHGHRRVEVAALEAGGADADSERQDDERAEHRPGGEPVERVERRHPDAEDAPLVALQPPLLPEVHRRHPGRERQPGEAGQHQDGVDCEDDAGTVALVERRPASRPREREQRGRDRHHRQPEQPVAGRAAPDQVRADDEPDEEVERAGPGSPREPVCRDDLADRAAPSAPASRSGRPTSRAGRRAPARAARPRRRTRPLRRRAAQGRRGTQPSDAALPRQLRELARLALEPGELGGDDRDVDEQRHEDDRVGRDDVVALTHERASRSSRRFESSRLPSSSTR